MSDIDVICTASAIVQAQKQLITLATAVPARYSKQHRSILQSFIGLEDWSDLQVMMPSTQDAAMQPVTPSATSPSRRQPSPRLQRSSGDNEAPAQMPGDAEPDLKGINPAAPHGQSGEPPNSSAQPQQSQDPQAPQSGSASNQGLPAQHQLLQYQNDHSQSVSAMVNHRGVPLQEPSSAAQIHYPLQARYPHSDQHRYQQAPYGPVSAGQPVAYQRLQPSPTKTYMAAEIDNLRGELQHVNERAKSALSSQWTSFEQTAQRFEEQAQDVHALQENRSSRRIEALRNALDAERERTSHSQQQIKMELES